MRLLIKRATNIFVALFLLIGLVLLFQGSLYAEGSLSTKKTNDTAPVAAEKQHSIYLSLGDEHERPSKQSQEIFDCTDKVFAVLELSNYPIGERQFTVLWTDPSDTVRERTEYAFHVRNDDTRLWAWLSLSRGFGGGMMQWMNPAAGLEDFIGIWEINVKIDGKSIGKENFEVSC